jgi:plasmid replication initiation protein
MSDDTKGKVVDAIAKDIIINSFHMNYNNVSEKFKDNVKSLVKQQLDSNKIVSL